MNSVISKILANWVQMLNPVSKTEPERKTRLKALKLNIYQYVLVWYIPFFVIGVFLCAVWLGRNTSYLKFGGVLLASYLLSTLVSAIILVIFGKGVEPLSNPTP